MTIQGHGCATSDLDERAFDHARAGERPRLTAAVARYSERMARYVIDAFTLLHLVDNDLCVEASHQLVAPNWIRSEALQLLLQDVRGGIRAEQAALAAHQKLTELKMRLLGDRVSRGTAWRIARDHDWDSLREAEYLAITRLQADAFVTVDERFAARAVEVVPVASVQALVAD